MNTVVNIAYMRVINFAAGRLYPTSETEKCFSHGDDVVAVLSSWLRGVLMFYCAEEAGFEASV